MHLLVTRLLDQKSHRLQGGKAAGLAHAPQEQGLTKGWPKQLLYSARGYTVTDLRKTHSTAKLFLHTCKSSSKFAACVSTRIPTECTGTGVEAGFWLRNIQGAHAGTAPHVTKTSRTAHSEFLASICPPELAFTKQL